ncbi:SRPBCC domain-containing protein [Paenibacillus sp. HJGM_3]|uniref:SRPBCC family protein n=1 Tax=Paenibacillus sp. HJGM_3 TaxID=3379816 RepID=UPI00385DA388
MSDSQATEHALVLSRVFNAPRELVFQAWTDPEHLKRWWGPKGFTLDVVQLDLRPGGMFLGSQRSPEGHVMWGKFVYEEISPPDKLVYIQSFCDAEGNTIRAPFNADWPLEIINILTLTEQDGQTLLTLQGGPINATEQERAAFEGMRPMVAQGFTATFDQLAQHLASQQQ